MVPKKKGSHIGPFNSYSKRVRPGTLKAKVYDFWVQYPLSTAKYVCEELDLSYKDHGNYVNKLLSEFRSYLKLGRPQKPHRLHLRTFRWDSVPRSLWPLDSIPAGWVQVDNRNRMWIFRDEVRGSVQWYRGGAVMLYLRGPVMRAKAKELFCRAFHWFDPRLWDKFLDVPLKEERRHWVFEVGGIMPRFDIRVFERSHGIRIFTDGSHPNAVEVEETTPWWIDKLENVQALFAENLEAHLKLIDSALKVIEDATGLSLKPPEKKPVPWEV